MNRAPEPESSSEFLSLARLARAISSTRALLLLALELGLIVLVVNSTMHVALKVGASAATAAAGIGIVYVRDAHKDRRRHQQALADREPQPRLGDLHRAAGRIGPGWFVSFTCDVPSPGQRPWYVSAIAHVDEVDGGDVVVTWRDRGVELPSRIPVALLDAPRVFRLAAKGRIGVDNRGVQIIGPGGVATGRGWAAHRRTPARIIETRARSLADDQRDAFEREADLGSYDLADLG